MGFDRPVGATLSIPAVKREEGEALSSWLARIAKVHLLTLDEVGEEISCPVTAADHTACAETLLRIARRTGANLADVHAAVHPHLTVTVSSRRDLDWRVCPQCLAADQEAGRAIHIRSAWTHPLVTVCLEHQAPLVIPSAENCANLLPEQEPHPRPDHGLRTLSGEPLDSLLRAARLVSPSAPVGPESLMLTREVRDLVDALGVQMNICLGRGAVLGLFEHPRRGRTVRAMSLELPAGLLDDLEAADRLLFVRAALAIRWPSADGGLEREVLGDWFSRLTALVVPKGRRRVIGAHALDPLGLLAVALPVRPFHCLRGRAARWSVELQRRWAAAEQLAALAGLN